MAKHLKNIVLDGLKNIVSEYLPSPALSTPPARGVRYLRFRSPFDFFWGIMDKRELGRKRRKHIIVRRFRHNGKRLLQLYTYHFPTHWSEACVANRELIKIAQRQAHAFEHDTSRAALEWRIRFLKHYFTVVKGNAAPEPGFKRYSRFYQYTYVALYRELQAARDHALAPSRYESLAPSRSETSSSAQSINSALTPEDVTFEPVFTRPLIHRPVLNPRFSMSPSRFDPPDIAPFLSPPCTKHLIPGQNVLIEP